MIKFQFNKTSLNDMGKQLKMREKALPTIKSKEAALRLEVKRAKDLESELNKRLEEQILRYNYMVELWGEFDTSLIEVESVESKYVKIAGVKIPQLSKIHYKERPYNLFTAPLWIADGAVILKSLAEIGIEREFMHRKREILEHTRKKTTQKVNLYEKVQIPGYCEAILKIKRFLEDEENLSKAAQKIVKSRIEAQTEEEVAV